MWLGLLWIVLAVQVAVVAGVLLALPRLMRRGLLFGVYVGEAGAESDEARSITRGWYSGTVAALAVGVLIGVAVDAAFPDSPAGPVASLFGLLALVPVVYLRAHVRARAIGQAHPVPESDAAVGPGVPADPATLLMMLLSVGAVRVGTGAAGALPTIVMWPALGLLLACSIGGSFYLMFRYGQGGARLERGAGEAPLTDGLADNRRWVLGVFYVNRDDPALLVEKRFGLGYTINFGNPVAVVLFVLLLVAIAAVALIGVFTGSG